ncbi:capsular exopolysaccharide synthesis family protein [Actinoplanes campanulatus]|uniref:Capsular exopolysaccharide synthesis family protein n=1 Tax=Actinoplanes campanulatus TaxID=113559 RepID=A0A7W5AGM6_9ACTN|nr:polysaccharide biosynthesis tyrosine autokinase [Actinoplanes campanulatus]MBB3095676.1 capsular exopolysaccharide synthesis family protein [Actinoplanes campanulatus]GGN10686.1 chromosome partitioning protein [Actinoplanes campanulatus]GID36569.1 chromosome partitioning protein [Actinoplanes campanulatus]
MGLREYLRVVRRHRWPLIASVAVALGVATIININTTPVYAARVTFFFATPAVSGADAYPASLFNFNRMSSYTELLTSDEVVIPVAATPGVDMDAEQIRAAIAAEPVPDTVMMKVSVQDQSRDRALLLLARLTGRFARVVEELERPAPAEPSTVQVTVVSGPALDTAPVSPDVLNNLALALVAGLILGAIGVVGREVTDRTVRTAAALQALTSAPVLARVPMDPGDPVVSRGASARTEALREIRTQVQCAAAAGSVRTLAVTSAVPGEGRSSTACGLALLFAEAGQRVLIVETEMRHPRLAAFLGREDAAGLSTVLNGGAELEQVLQPWGAGLWLLAGGPAPPNPSELLSSSRMTELVEEARRRFDVVVFDCPPLLPVTDGGVVAARADRTLLVVRAHRTTSAQVTAAVQTLHAVGATLLGCVLNMVARKGPDAVPNYDTYLSGSGPARGDQGGRKRPAS